MINHVKINTDETYLFGELKKSIKDESPFSYARIGDGEIHILTDDSLFTNKIEIIEHKKIMNSIYKRYDTNSKNTKLIQDLRNIILRTIKNSDYLGIPNIANFDKLSKLVYQLKMPVLEKYKINNDALKICDATFNRSDLIGNINNFKDLIGNRPIHIMTSNMNRLMNVSKIHKLLNVPISYTQVNHIQSSKERSFYKREFIMNSLPNIKEHIVLYGLGEGAKDACHTLRNNYGKCVIDMGSVLDAWSGQISRPKYKNVYSHCMIGDRKNWKIQTRR